MIMIFIYVCFTFNRNSIDIIRIRTEHGEECENKMMKETKPNQVIVKIENEWALYGLNVLLLCNTKTSQEPW